MNYVITGLDPTPFRHLFGRSDEDLAALCAHRYIVDEQPGFPDRIELRDASIGESVILVNHMHQPAANPYRSSHAVFVREGAAQAATFSDGVPDVLRSRFLSVRAFDADHMMVEADALPGTELDARIRELLGNDRVAYLHVHFAKQGCYAALVRRT